MSNVLIDESYRGLGFGKVLMNAVERHAQYNMGFNRLTLHVDADTISGKAAQALYYGLGYTPIVDNRESASKQNVNFSWIGDSIIQDGLYFIDGVPLLYLQKALNDNNL